jgi:hypothetical protein
MRRSGRVRAKAARSRPMRERGEPRSCTPARLLPVVKSLVAVSVRQTTANRVQRRPGRRRPTIHPTSRPSASQIAAQRKCSAQMGCGVTYAIADGRSVSRLSGAGSGANSAWNERDRRWNASPNAWTSSCHKPRHSAFTPPHNNRECQVDETVGTRFQPLLVARAARSARSINSGASMRLA